MSIEARSLTVSIAGKTLLDAVSLAVQPGEVLAVLGANGAGKTTLLRALSGEIKSAPGAVWMGGRPLAAWKLAERARVRAVLPQNSTLSFSFSALEIVLMGRAPHVRGIETAVDYTIAQEALALVDALHLAGQSYVTLSGGERQRVQLARVLAQIWTPPPGGGARYMLIDEPTNNLDLAHQHRTLEIAQDFARAGTAVLAILHDLNLAAQYADRVAILKQGRILAEGTPRAVLTPDIIQAGFNMPVTVIPHPHLDVPLVVPAARR